MIPYELLQDLNKLACRSKNKKIEDLFVKLAQELPDFYDWIIKNLKNTHITSHINNVGVMSTLQFLITNKDIKQSSIPKSIAGVGFVLYTLLNEDPAFKSTLNPFSESLSEFATFAIDDKDLKAKVIYDLNYLDNTYNHSKANPDNVELDARKGKAGNSLASERSRKARFVFLHERLKDEISSAIQSRDEYSKTYDLIKNGRLPHYQEVALSLPYMPNLGGLSSGILNLVNRAGRDYKANPQSTNAFNDVRTEAFRLANINAKPKLNKEQENRDSVDYSKIDPDVVSPQESQENKIEYDHQYVAQAEYILIIAMVLAKLAMKWNIR